MTKEELKQYIDQNIYENVDGDISGDSLNEILKAIVDDGGTEVEANPTGEATTPLTKIKIGETNYNIPQTDTSNLATKQELQQGLSGKQDTIADLEQIRTRADEGHTALQPLSGAQENNFASFDANGDIKDSGCNEDTFIKGVKKGTETLTPDDGVVTIPSDIESAFAQSVPSNQNANANIVNHVLQLEIPRGADAVNPFKGYYPNTKPTGIFADGDYIYAPDATDGSTITIWYWDENLSTPDWSDSGNVIDPAALVEFANTSKAVAATKVINDLITGGSTDLLSAEQGSYIGTILGTLGNIITQQLSPTRNGTKINANNAYAVFFSSIDVSGKDYLWIHINKHLESGYVYVFGYTLPDGTFTDVRQTIDIPNGFYQHNDNDWLKFDVKDLNDFEFFIYKTTLPFDYPTSVEALRVTDFNPGEGVIYIFDEPIVNKLNNIESSQNITNEILSGTLEVSTDTRIQLASNGKTAIIKNIPLIKDVIYNVEINVEFDTSREGVLYIGFAHDTVNNAADGTYSKTSIKGSETQVTMQFKPNENYSNGIFYISNWDVNSSNYQYITATITNTSIIGAVNSIPETVNNAIPKGIKNVSLIPTKGFIPNIDTVNKIIDFGSDPVLIVGDANIAPYATWRNIPIYEDGNNSGAIKMIVNTTNKTMFCKGTDYTLAVNEVVVGTFRLEYRTHDFVSANMPFDFTIDGKKIESIDWSSGLYLGEPINISYKTRLAFTRNYFSGSISNWHAQGMDVYDNRYIIQGNDAGEGNATICVLDIVNKVVVGEVEISEGAFHSNNVNIGNKYDASDVFPLIYVSECYGTHSCKVIRLADDVSICTILQTITYSGTHYVNAPAQDWFIDVENNYLYSFGIKTGGDTYQGPFEILKFSLPSTSNQTVALTDNDILATFETSDFKVYQGQKVINGKLYLPFGFGTSSRPGGLAVFDFDKETVISKISGLPYEPEGIGVYNGDILINSSGGNYYLFEF